MAGPAAAADAAVARLTQESGRLQVMDWAGYGNDGGQAMFAAYVHQHPQNKPQFTHMTNESDALAKIHAGAHPDLFRPYVGWVKYFAKSGLVQPWNPRLIPNFKHLNPFMVKAGQYNGKQYGIPDDWGFDAILYRKDKVHPKAQSWSLLFDEPVQGQDRLVRRPEDDHGRRALPPREEPVEPDERGAQPLRELPEEQEASGASDLGVARPISDRRSPRGTSGSRTRGRTTGCR